MMKRRLINIFIFCILSICCNAQIEGYKFYAALDTVKTAGFYNITLTPEINTHLKTDYSDVRIVDAGGKWVPHALHIPTQEITMHSASMDLKYSALQNNKINTTVIIEGQNRTLNNIELNIRNTEAERYCSLSGSDDNKNWFVISDSVLINPIPTETKSINTFKFDFPLNNYKFYKLIIFNRNKDPYDVVGITSAGIAKITGNYYGKIISNPTTTILQNDSGKITYLKITQQHPYHFDGFNIKLSGSKYYSRKAEITFPHKASIHFIISNNSNLSFPATTIANDSIFYIKIFNDDNPALKVNEVNTTLNEPILKAYLEVGNSYRLIMDNKNAVEPVYDISKLNIKGIDSFLPTKNIIAFPQQEIKNTKEKNNKWMIWAALVAGLAVLLLLTKKMIIEVNKKNNNDTL